MGRHFLEGARCDPRNESKPSQKGDRPGAPCGILPLSAKIAGMALILASASPRRQELLRSAGIAITVQPTNVPEVPLDGEAPKAFAERLAREKAWAIFKQRPNEFVLGADTIVVVDKQILGKPK